LLSTSNNKISATWKITKTITGRTNLNDGITTIFLRLFVRGMVKMARKYRGNKRW
jgi:hypothetical protein